MLTIGSRLPDITLDDQAGVSQSLLTLVGHPMVIFFYPKNETTGCTIEACSFRDHYEQFQEQGALVIGISGDTVESHNKFAGRRNLPYLLLSDSRRRAEKAFGVPRKFLGLIPGRVTFVVNKQGLVTGIFTGNPWSHVKQGLEMIKKIQHAD